ncbi:MAG: hydrogenase expression/formation protein HypE [Gaiellaceae bacterium]|nr:MAG: hydrogenase expression/formation protein HypE [Gaiellaceae bacterium]
MPEPRTRRVLVRDKRITLTHGAGGKATRDLVEALFLDAFGNDALAPLGDSAVVSLPPGRVAVTTDSYVVRPLAFPGGDIGELAVNGTVNDLAVAGARPLWLTAGFVLEEGLPIDELRAIVTSMASAAGHVGVAVAAGDTKVVERGKADGLYVTTAGVGVLEHDVVLGPERVHPGDRVVLSGTLADHGVAVLIARGDLRLEGDIQSDTAPVHELAAALLGLGEGLRWMRDPTRGGLATALNELAAQSGLAVRLREDALPIEPAVAAACEILGIDPLYVANEGKLVAVVAPDVAAEALARLRAHPLGAEAVEIGAVEPEPEGMVLLDTALGGSRIVDLLVGDPLPRIC